MPAMHISHRHRDDPMDHDVVNYLAEHGTLLHDDSGEWNVFLIGQGMASGKPAIILFIPTDKGAIFLETSLDAWRAATVGLAAMAETHYGYTISD